MHPSFSAPSTPVLLNRRERSEYLIFDLWFLGNTVPMNFDLPKTIISVCLTTVDLTVDRCRTVRDHEKYQ